MQIPPGLIASLKNTTGFNREAFEAIHQSGEQVTSIRLNPSKLPGPGFPLVNVLHSKIPWSTNGYYLSERPSFTTDPLFHAGAYYVQEASSMFLEQAIRQLVDLSQPVKVLDLCAAPGGKSTLIQSLISSNSLLVSNEVIKPRANILAENITKWGAANVVVTNNDPKDFQRLQNYFDIIVVDAPCSGSGLFRKDPAAITEWSEQNVQLCSQRQQRILADILPALKENGVLIYSTCSFSEKEDEEIADWLCGSFAMQSLRLITERGWNIVETLSSKQNAHGYRFYPDQVKGEGFFIAAFKKAGCADGDTSGSAGRGKSKSRSEKIPMKEAAIVQPYLKEPTDFIFISQDKEVIAFPKQLEEDLIMLQNALYIKKAGVKLGTVIRDELIPDHELALSTIINPTLRVVETERENALQYLRRQDIKITIGYTGWALLAYNHLSLGWIKVLPNRINNYYPKEWRILNK